MNVESQWGEIMEVLNAQWMSMDSLMVSEQELMYWDICAFQKKKNQSS